MLRDTTTYKGYSITTEEGGVTVYGPDGKDLGFWTWDRLAKLAIDNELTKKAINEVLDLWA